MVDDPTDKPLISMLSVETGGKAVVAGQIFGGVHLHLVAEPTKDNLDQPTRPIVHLPQRPPLFIGREPEIEALRYRLEEPGSVAYISGMAGRGKTTLALEYAHRYRDDFEAVHWLPCQGRSLVQIAGELAWQLGLRLDGDLSAIVLQLNVRCARHRSLLILDNVENDRAAQLMPGGLTSVLITTRLTSLPFLRFDKPLNLALFTENQCFDLFHEVLGKQTVEKEEAEARLLFRRLGHLPIGIAVAASLVRTDVRYTITGLAKKLPTDVYALFKEAIAALSPLAQTLLASMTVCATDGFRLALAAEVVELNEASSLDALQEIHSRSLVEELDRTTRRYRLHALVREAACSPDLQRRKHAECVGKEFQDWENRSRECEKDMADWQVAFSWLLGRAGDEDGSWFSSLRNKIRQSFSPWRDPWLMANVLASTGWALTLRLGRLTEAHEICERMVREANHRGDLRKLQAWYGNQAVILHTWGRLDEAMTLYEKQEAISKELGYQVGLATSYGNQSVVMRVWGRLGEAMELLDRQEHICQKLGDQNGLQLIYGNRAAIFHTWGRLDEAFELLKRQEVICRELGDQDGVAKTYGNQGLILSATGRLDEAMAMYKKTEAIMLVMGDQDGLQATYGNQAIVLRAWGRLDEALELLKKQEAICQELGKKDGLALTYGNQASIMRARERLDEALELLKKQEAICEELGNQDGLANTYLEQSLIMRARGRLDEALELLKKQEAISQRLGNRDGLQRTYNNQSMIMRAWGRLDEALELLGKQEAICLELGQKEGLALCYANWGRLAKEQNDGKTEREKLGLALAIFTELKMPNQIKAVELRLAEANGDRPRT